MAYYNLDNSGFQAVKDNDSEDMLGHFALRDLGGVYIIKSTLQQLLHLQ
jgi:hypothetical protein